MQSTWNHPTWGNFEYDSVAWTKTIEVPSFARFSFDSGEPGTAPSSERYPLSFEVEDESVMPSNEAVAMAEALIANQAALVDTIVNALWDDFNGEGPYSGMWWHSNLEEITEGMESDVSIASPEDLLPLLQVSSITVHTDVYGHEGPLIEISFHAPFEEEHGIGVLTDGAGIFGTGYSVSVTPFKDWSEE